MRSQRHGKPGTPGTVAQARFESKGGLVNLLQENIERHYSGKKLISVYLVLRKTGDGDFVPDLKVTIDETKEYTRDREIRMIYKLTEEHPDAEVRAIAKKTFFLQERQLRSRAADIVGDSDAQARPDLLRSSSGRAAGLGREADRDQGRGQAQEHRAVTARRGRVNRCLARPRR
jgi:hypothetical protein